MSLAIASARDQYVLLRNFTTGKWENIAGDGKTCRIQVMKKADGDHLLRITPDGGQKRELKLSKENRIHFARGFIQVPVADSKELYGIKFKETNLVEGEEFYTKLIKAIGVPCSYLQTTIGTDGNPDPVGQKPATKSVPQSLPPQAQTGNKPANISQLPKAKVQPSSQAPPPIFATLGSQPSKSVAPHQGWKPEATPQVIKEVKPIDSQQKFHHHPSPQKQPTAAASVRSLSQPNQFQPGGGGGGGGANRHGLHAGSSAHRQPTDAGRPINDRDQGASAAKYDNVVPMGSPRNQVTFAPSQAPQQNLTPQKNKQPTYQNVTPYYSPAPPDRSRSADVTVVGSNLPPQSGFSLQPNPSSVGQLKSRFHQEAKPHPPSTPSNQPTAVNGHSKGKDYFDGATASNVMDKTSTSGPSVARQQQQQQPPPFLPQPRPSASPKLQRSSLKPSDMKSVAEAMSDAMNRCDERLAREKFEALMNFMRTSKTGGRCEMSFSAVPEPEPEPSQSTFTLNVQVEFQNPNKEPIPIFLDDVSPDTTINVLSARVEHHFYIPRLSQNWIIGTRLVKGTDMNKSLRDFDIRGSGVGGGGVSVFMYVMHTKKAQVPNEAAKVRQQHVQHRQQQQQSTQSADQERPPVPRVAWAADPIAT